MQRIEGHSSEELPIRPHLPLLPFHRPAPLPIRLVLHAAQRNGNYTFAEFGIQHPLFLFLMQLMH